MSENFDQYSNYYNLLNHNKDYTSEAEYISACLRKYLDNPKEILEFGSGTGGHGLLLQKMGYNIFGIERSEKMVSEAKQRGFKCQQGDIIEFSTGLKKYDAVISLFHVISYISDNASLISVFRNAADSIKPGGLFIFDVWYSPAVLTLKPETRIRRAENDRISVLRYAEPISECNKNIVNVRYTILVRNKATGTVEEFEEIHPMRHFSYPEIDLISKFTDFSVVRAEEFLTGQEPSEKTWGVNFILRKNG